MWRSARWQRFIGAVAILFLSVFSELMLLVLSASPLGGYHALLSVVLPMVGALTVCALLFGRGEGELRFAPRRLDWGLLYLSAAGFCWMAGWRFAQGIGMVVELAPLPCIMGVLVFLMYRREEQRDSVRQVFIREVTEQEWNARTNKATGQQDFL